MDGGLVEFGETSPYTSAFMMDLVNTTSNGEMFQDFFDCSPLRLSRFVPPGIEPIVVQQPQQCQAQQAVKLSPKTTVPRLSLPQCGKSKAVQVQAPAAAAVAPAASSAVQERPWKIISQEPTSVITSSTVSVGTKRVKIPNETLDDTLFSCFKYVIHHSVESSLQVPFLRAVVTVVFADRHGVEVTKNDAPIVEGKCDIPLTRVANGSKNRYEGAMDIKFTSVSFHHEKSAFAFKVSYFVPTAQESSVLVKVSPAFMLMARKPNRNASASSNVAPVPSQQQTKKKRVTRDEGKDCEVQMPASKFQATQHLSSPCKPLGPKSAALLDLESRIEHLVGIYSTLGENEKSVAKTQLISRFFQHNK